MTDKLIPGQLYRYRGQPGILKFSHLEAGCSVFDHHSEEHEYAAREDGQIGFGTLNGFERVTKSQIIEVW